jgi:hypothetical protein
MPIKFNITKHDVLAGRFHQLVQRTNGTALTGDDALLHAQATLIASFSPGHSWQTNRSLLEKDLERLRSSQEIKNEYVAARTLRWKIVGSKDIQEVSQMSIPDGLFSVWLAFNTEKEKRDVYKSAWSNLQKEFREECDRKESPAETARV